LTVADSPTRRTWIPVLAQQWQENCGVRLLTTFIPVNILSQTGAAGSLSRRDFEAVSLAWVTGADPNPSLFYGCDTIPSAATQWDGFNIMGWCDPSVEESLAALEELPGASKEERAALYQQIEEEFFGDAPSLPLFSSLLFYGVNSNLQNYDPQPVDQDLWNIDTWTLPGTTHLVVKFGQEPANLLTDRSPAAQRLASAIHDRPLVNIAYDPQPHALTQLPTAQNGGVKEQVSNVQAGDLVYNSAGILISMTVGAQIKLADDSIVLYSGGVVAMNQPVVEYQFRDDLRWSDGTPITAEDYQLAYDAICSPVGVTIGVNEEVCEPIALTNFSDGGYTLTFYPGYDRVDFSTPPFTFLPSHQIIQSAGEHQGKALGDIPFEDWLELPEVTDTILTTGPFQVTEWIHGERMELVANPFYRLGPLDFERLTVRFDLTNAQAYQALVAGTVHLSDGIAGTNSPNVKVFQVPGNTWEHIDFNFDLFDQSVSRVISSTGGTLGTALGISLSVASGVFPSDTTVIINHLPRPSHSLANIGTPIQVFDVSFSASSGIPISATADSVDIYVTYTDKQLGALDEETLKVMHWNGAQWQPVTPCDGCVSDAGRNLFHLRVRDFSEFALVGRGALFVPSLHREEQ
jgi:ABC-type transport system substrate-binding protein